MIDLGIVKIDWTVNAGQLLVTGAGAAVAYGMRRVYQGAMSFVKKVTDNDARLGGTESVLDQHTRHLVDWEPIKDADARYLHRRRHDDEAEDLKARI